MRICKHRIPDILTFEPALFEDDRGFFYESYNQKELNEAVGKVVTFVQDNHSRSVRGTLRGLHYQLPPHPQGKLVRVTVGEVFDVAVDIREGSPTFGQWVGVRLSADNLKQLWVPPGFAHGFLTTSDVAEVQYKCTDFYTPDCEATILWNDPDLKIDWPLQGCPLLSEKDGGAPAFADATKFP
ncbi:MULTISPECIES: dTDP-4-dehydrorhamnose 3,5-epimerase [unclassified Thioalkalivibrio]|uniref:dTDP-4-dehydrorhamnose 3,5-epimerase n=1 Tax=unclassified Thioalkalivibrio TaxID=2621013 RepID=UPI00036903E2|nr:MULTISPECIES: dTDP-4-dehydrorhamnose 3,5-epimerase [unclassified Thioalkalivibrio]